jgi:hypothetical protein
MDEDQGFKELRQEIMGYGKEVQDRDKIVHEGKLGVYLVVTYEIRGYYEEMYSSKGLYELYRDAAKEERYVAVKRSPKQAPQSYP